MHLPANETFILILAVALGTIITRFTPFILFPEHKKHPAVIAYLSKVLPPAMMGLLVVYCLKSVSLFTYPYGIPEGIAVTAVAALHIWRRNVFLSIAGGTALYMFLVQKVFM